MAAMNRPHPTRFGMVVMLVLSMVMMLVSFWILEVMRRSTDEMTPAGERIEPDYFVEGFTFLRTSLTGQAQYNISGKRLTHNPVDDSHAVVQPVVNSFGSDRPPLKATSRTALISGDNSKVHLYEDVRIDRPPSSTVADLHLRSEYLLILPDEDVMRTDKPVEITTGKSRLTGTGMVANNATRQLQLAANVKAVFAPPTQR